MRNYKYRGKKILEFDKLRRVPGAKRELSIILPTYNEEGNIEKLVRKLRESLRRIDYEIVIVDDNSKDKTPQIIDGLAEKFKGRIITLHRHNKRGLLSAFLDGIFISNGEFIVTMDSDFSHPPEVIRKMWRLRDRYDFIVGSRFVKGGRMEAPFLRVFGSFLINQICAFILGLKIKDIAGNFHLIRKNKFEKLKFKYDSVFGEFDFEWLYRAKKAGFKIKEIPFTYKFREQGETKMAEDIFGLFRLGLVYIKRAFQLRLFD